MTMKPWREIAIPHEDVLKGTFQQAEFAADLSLVHSKAAAAEYQQPDLFFQRTFITEGMRLLLGSVVNRLAGRGGDPVIQLQTAFGGGKTHTMLAVYHLTSGQQPASRLAGIPPILDAAQITELPAARVAVLDGNKLAPNIPQNYGNIAPRTLWGELAYQLGGQEGYAMVEAADTSGTSPGKEVLAQLLSAYAPCVILIDELVAYIRQFEEGKSYTGGTYDSNISFIQALTEALKSVPTAVLLASLPESDKEAGSQRGINALRTLEHYFGRVQALWKPVATQESFEIVRRRLFARIADTAAAESVCRAYADFYTANGTDMPEETQKSEYFERLRDAYPIHPEVFVRLYEDWSTIDNFQRTRGVLKLMAKVIHRLWKDGNNDAMIMPGSLPLYDADTRNEVIYYLPQGWDPVLESDIDGERAETTLIEHNAAQFGSLHACRRAARTIFLGSTPSPNQMARGLESKRVLLGCAQPGQAIGVFQDALKRMRDQLQFLNFSNDRYWFDNRPNLRREMEERKRRFDDQNDIFPAIRERLQKLVGGSSVFGGVHVFTPSADIADDWALRLVVLPPDAPHSKAGNSSAIKRAAEVLKNRGDQPRQKQNRLIFLAAGHDTVARLNDIVRSMLAWQTIVDDVHELKLNLDALQSNQARKNLEEAKNTVTRMIAESYKWVLAPHQDAAPGKGVSEIQWDQLPLNSGAANLQQEITRVLKENELVIGEWAAIHLSRMLRDWFWKPESPEANAISVWQKSCNYLYLPRLRDESVFRAAIASGTNSADFFGIAQGKGEEQYVGFNFNQSASPSLDGSLLLIEPNAAANYQAVQQAKQQTMVAPIPPSGGSPIAGGDALPGRTNNAAGGNGNGDIPPVPHPKVMRQFYGSIELDPVEAKRQFSDVADEILMQFTSRTGVSVTISVEIQAESAAGFNEAVQRAVKENSRVLKFKSAEFEEG
ncbi:MAG: ATP-binding protein [Chlorobi bacterium]|nr:ATP-binding protein [Chlorobiota bacterium]